MRKAETAGARVTLRRVEMTADMIAKPGCPMSAHR